MRSKRTTSVNTYPNLLKALSASWDSQTVGLRSSSASRGSNPIGGSSALLGHYRDPLVRISGYTRPR